jgi:hypothetical protein
VLALVAAAVLAGTSAARDDDRWSGHRGFDKRSIKGAYGYNSSLGWLVATGPNQPVSPPVPFAGMGRIVFDGQGGCEVTSIGNLNGQSVPSTASSCRYDVNPDGTGTAEAVFPGAPIADPIPIAFVITDQATAIGHSSPFRMLYKTASLALAESARRCRPGFAEVDVPGACDLPICWTSWRRPTLSRPTS